MAEGIVTELIKVLVEKLAEKALKEIARSQGIQSELKNLEKKLFKIQKLLADASEKENGDQDVKDWLNRLQHLAYDIDDILDGLATDAMIRELNEEPGEKAISVRKFIPTCCTNFSLSNQFSDKLDRIAIKLQDLEKEKVDLGLTVKDASPKNPSRGNETGVADKDGIVGRDGEKKQLMHQLLGNEACDENFSIVPIVGLGGVGKTTLARSLYNEKEVKDHFALRVWVCVSDEFDIFKISNTIFKDVPGEDRAFADLNQLQKALIEKFSEKRFLLVLDDVWSENDDEWQNLVKPFHSGAPGSKIIVTTRKEQLLKKLGCDHIERIDTLSHDDALSLFAYHALGAYNFDSHSTLKPQGEGIVNKCRGLPLALKAIGKLLGSKTVTDVEDWEYVLNSEIWDLENADKIVPALRLSYNDLPACLKQLFAYCSLFLKDFMFDRDDLVLLWMAEGFLNQAVANKRAERLGHEYFEMLLSRSFFQRAPNDESLYVMHDLMNELGVFVARDYFLRFDNKTQIEKEALAKYRHMSFIREEFVAYQKFETFKRAKSLRTFLAVGGAKKWWKSFYLSNKILVEVLPQLHLLRVLCLNGFEITEVPEFIGRLKHLRYLNLSQTKITELPENVCSLYNLETLIVFGCLKLSKLPNSFLKLKSLRHFDIRDTPLLKKMPLGISELKNLQTLTKIVIGEDDGFSITELKKLKNLNGKMSIEGLDKVKNATYARDTNFSLNRLTELELIWGDVFDGSRNEAVEKEVLNEMKPRSDKLKKLSIKLYEGAEFPNWVGDPSFRHLVHVSINGCRKCISMPSLSELPSLKELYIKDVNEVKVVGSEFFGTTGVAFPSLEVLHFENMSGWEVWSTNSIVVFPRLRKLCLKSCRNLVEVSVEMLPCLEILRFEDMTGWKVWSTNSVVVFPRLRELCLRSCPNLVEVLFESLPSLRVLEINECGDGLLRSIVRAAPAVTKLNVSGISGLTDEAWKGVMIYLGTVEELEVRKCDEIRYLWESEAHASKVFVNLRKLKLRNCSKLVSLGEKVEEEGNCGSNLLTSLTIYSCKSMKHCICGHSIESLDISNCPSMTSVSFPSTATETTTQAGGGEQNLKSLEIYHCEKLLIKELGGENINDNKTGRRRMAMLESVDIRNWKNLKSIIELSYSIHLTQLIIWNCPSLESFPDRELLNLTSLKDLTITNCPSMDASFPGGNWPPKMCRLEIGGLKKPMSEWGNQNFPTSLVDLALYGEGEECNNISLLSDLVPPSLTCLGICYFEKLESVSRGLQHLTSLQHLKFFRCPKIKDLPETLLPSLLSLSFWKCPSLGERSSRSGRYWPLISHIPKIDIRD